MNDKSLEAWGKRYNSHAKVEVAFEPEAEILKPDPIELDIPALDDMLGGGIPRGRTTTLFGEKSAGKTLLSQLIIAAAQRQGGKAVFIDAERTFSSEWFCLTGVDTSPENLLVIRPRNLEQTFDIICDLVDGVKPEVIVLDSIPALVPKSMLLDKKGKVKMEDQDFRGITARKLTEGITKTTIYNSSTALVLINQMRVEMGKTFGNPEKMPGGKALKFYSSVMIRVRQGKWLTDAAQEGASLDDVDEKDAKRIGFLLRLRTEYNKLAPPWQECDLKFKFTGEVDSLGSLIHLAVQRKVILYPTKGWYVLPYSGDKVHGLPALEKLLRENEELKQEIIIAVKEAK